MISADGIPGRRKMCAADEHLVESIPNIRQGTPNDCGRAVLTTVAQFFGLPIDSLDRPDLQGESSLWMLRRAARATGLRAVPVKATRHELGSLRMPCVALCRSTCRTEGAPKHHFIAIFRVDDDGLLVRDPNVGTYKMSNERFEQRWIGILMLLSPRTHSKKEKAHERRKNQER